MSRVLVIDDDAGTLFGYKHILRSAGHEVSTAALGEDGVLAAQRDQFDVVLCDQRLPDIAGVDVVRQIHRVCRRTSIVLVTAWGTPELAMEARRNGAVSLADKPLIGEDLVRVVQDAVQRSPVLSDASDGDRAGYAERRWADLVVRGVYLIEDPKTIPVWSRGIALALGTLKKRCQAAQVAPKKSLDLIRLLRIVDRHSGEPWNLQRRLDIVDERTAVALLARAGLGADGTHIPDLRSFLSHQRLIVRPGLVDALRGRLHLPNPRTNN